MFPVRGALLLSRAITVERTAAELDWLSSGSFHYFTNKFCLFKCLRRAGKIFKANPLRAESESWTLPMGAYAEWRALLRPARLLKEK